MTPRAICPICHRNIRVIDAVAIAHNDTAQHKCDWSGQPLQPDWGGS